MPVLLLICVVPPLQSVVTQLNAVNLSEATLSLHLLHTSIARIDNFEWSPRYSNRLLKNTAPCFDEVSMSGYPPRLYCTLPLALRDPTGGDNGLQRP